jgi:CHAT domain-containing protein
MSRYWNKTEHYISDKFKEEWKETLTKFAESYDVTDFNYAIAFGDNSTPHESKGNLKQARSFAYYLADPTNVTNVPPKIKGQNYNYTGEILYVSGSYKMSEKSFLKAEKIYNDEQLSDSAFANLTLSNLGLLYHTTGRYTLAEEYTKNALTKREQSSDKTGYAASLNNLAVLYKDMGLYTDAETYIIKAENHLKSSGETQTVQYAVVLNNHAMINQMTGKYTDAEKLMKQSLEIAGKEIKEKSVTFVRLQVNLALLYQLTKRYEEAEKTYDEATKIMKKKLGKNHPDYAVLLRNKASLYQQMKRFEQVENLLKEAREIYSSQFGKEHPSYAQVTYETALFYQSQNRLEEAEPLLNEALTIQQKTLSEHHPNIALTFENMAILYWQKEDFINAAEWYRKSLNEYSYQINTFFPVMNDYEKTEFWENIQAKFIRFYNFALDAETAVPEITEDVYNYHIATKALLLNSSRKVKARILNSGNQELIANYKNWQGTKNWLAKLYSYTNEELAEEKINIDSLETLVKNLEKELTVASKDFKDANELSSADYKKIANALKPGEAAIELIRINSYSYLFPKSQIHYIGLVLRNDNKKPEMIFFKDGDDMESSQSDEYQATIHSGKSMAPFYDYYWKPVDELTLNDKKLYVSVDGIYNQVNINTILMPSGKSLVELKDVRFVSNTKDILTFKTKTNNQKTAFLLGFPDYKLDLPDNLARLNPLPGTQKEVQAIQNLLKSNAWQVSSVFEKQATEGNLKKVKNPYILHIATHGYFLENTVDPSEETRAFGIEPMKAYENPLLRSGLLLAGADRTVNEMNTKDNKDNDDGILNAFEAMILNLDQTDLVVLSACQTGLGEIKNGEGVYGLQRSFQIAGAKSVITSLWEVSDEGTQDLMSAFYKYWLLSGNKHDAFRKAQLEIKQKYQYPYYWGAFVLVGD